MWPIDDSTMKSGPSMPPMVRALAGDSTMTSALPTTSSAGLRSMGRKGGHGHVRVRVRHPPVKGGPYDRGTAQAVRSAPDQVNRPAQGPPPQSERNRPN